MKILVISLCLVLSGIAQAAPRYFQDVETAANALKSMFDETGKVPPVSPPPAGEGEEESEGRTLTDEEIAKMPKDIQEAWAMLKPQAAIFKSVGGWGWLDTHTHPSSSCTIMSEGLTIENHDMEAEGYEVTIQKRRSINNAQDEKTLKVDWATLLKSMDEADAETTEVTKEFGEIWKTPAIYTILRPTLQEHDVKGEKKYALGQRVVNLYVLLQAEAVRKGPASDLIIKTVDGLCPGTPAFENVVPKVQR